MTCCEGWTSCNGFSLLFLLLFGVILNAVPLVISTLEGNKALENPISCFEWWFPGIIGAGLMAIPATTMSLSARKRACCNHKTGMLFSSLTNVLTVVGAVYCILVSTQALLAGPLICNPQHNSTANCKFSLKDLDDFNLKSFNLEWFLSNSCVQDASSNSSVARAHGLHFDSKEKMYRMVHFSVFLGLLLVGSLEVLFALSQMVIGFLGCLCGVSRQRSRIV
ncbi:transmembrane 4 L6 family member 20 [Echinops telfairi]|uniref:Transmembrane 4 L6 family member 20 n=1 Tax=Echinops telfairi TaxID=9371 RepID=A0ABM0IK03_ECHTE|nr:transmembrane 4 L6 family member 20 [Echinops telfairi]